jgi:hypothetical protein
MKFEVFSEFFLQTALFTRWDWFVSLSIFAKRMRAA